MIYGTTITGNTYRTSEYGMFKRLEGNRNVLAARVNKIKGSIAKNGYIFNPIVVNERYEVIDGQGRLEALKILQLPVDFVVATGAGLEQCIALNAYGTLWTMTDYIDSFCELGNENYMWLREQIKQYHELRIKIVIMLATGLASIPNETIKSGNLIIREEQRSIAEKDLMVARRFVSSLKRVKGNTDTYFYAITFAMKCGASERRMFDSLDRSEIPPAPKLRNALDNISDIYNKNLHGTANRIYLFQKYEETMSSKYGWYGAKWSSMERKCPKEEKQSE